MRSLQSIVRLQLKKKSIRIKIGWCIYRTKPKLGQKRDDLGEMIKPSFIKEIIAY